MAELRVAPGVRIREARRGEDWLLWDADRLPHPEPHHFDPDWWSARGESAATGAGRGSAWFVGPEHEWALRHYRRGGWIARWVEDHYLWLGAARSRAFREWRLLARLTAQGLPVPKPVATRVRRQGCRYRADLLTVRVPGAETLAERLTREALASPEWQALGELLARFHAAGVYHHDLNAHNILVDGQNRFTLIDLDRGRIRRPGGWQTRTLRRLHRSLDKIGAEQPALHFHAADWQALYGGYLMQARCAADRS